MKQMKKKLGILLFGVLMFLLAVPVMAEDVTGKKEIDIPAQRVEHSITGQTSGMPADDLKDYFDFTSMARMASDSYYLTESLPKQNAVLTKGDRLYVKFYARDTWKYYYTKPIVSVFDSNDEIVYMNADLETVSLSGQDTYAGYLPWNTSKAAPGRYYVYIVSAPCNENGVLLDNWTDFDCPYIKTGFTLKAGAHTHRYSSWKTVKAATVFATGKKECKCTYCGAKKTQTIPKLKPTVKLSATKRTIARNKYYTLKITGLARGDSVRSVRSSKTSVAVVKKTRTNQYRITGKRKGTATVTVILKSGKKAVCKVTVK